MKAIVIGQIALIILGLFLIFFGVDALIEATSVTPSPLYTAYSLYFDLPPLQTIVMAILCLIAAVLLTPFARNGKVAKAGKNQKIS